MSEPHQSMKIIPVNDKYEIHVPNLPVYPMVMGVLSPHANQIHPNLLAARSAVMEFKHYRATGSKFWTSKPGVDYVLAFPREAIEWVPKETTSYPEIIINGVMVRLNTSGGTAPPGWVDWVHVPLHTCLHGVRVLRKILEVALPPKHELARGLQRKPEDANEGYHWLQLMSRNTPLTPGMTVVLTEYHGERRYIFEKYCDGRKEQSCSSIIAIPQGKEYGRYKIRPSQIDWIATREANDIALPKYINWSRIKPAEVKEESCGTTPTE